VKRSENRDQRPVGVLPDCARFIRPTGKKSARKAADRQHRAACPNSDIENLESKHQRVSLKHRVITRK
jgi:hypothetical protein